MADVFSELVGQERVVDTLRRAVAGARHAMTHAWLFVGPPGSGRSNAARAFAAALQCPEGGCGRCEQCRTSLAGAHPDVTLVRTEQLSIGVKETREMVSRANVSPVQGRYQVVVVEDADRVTERGADALLKGLEEPAPRTVWLLCAPNPDDVIITIRSRCRVVQLLTPSDAAVAQLLMARDGVDEAMAWHAARAAQGHVGRARALARNEDAWRRRFEVLSLPGRLRSLTDCLVAAENLVAAAKEEADGICEPLDQREMAALQQSLGVGTRGARPRNTAGAIKDLEEEQKTRRKRMVRDCLDRTLTELTSFYRDVLAIQCGADAKLINADLRDVIEPIASRRTPEQTVRALDVILDTRRKLEGNVSPQLAFEALLIGVTRG
ncbi:DNA polymerase III subunit delta' [Tessaracoccus sp. OH4464_COT-324]|uniref:DNA polymerase III subunit delta' n=1 Tax=Tessaracoccus sp. OH4464_COT-324 TaxID=2491059 RepID=UPI000F63DA3A|nr:DNA polymerase III subunit delta' [Tessaracoccus sp. OH4464_COT-324]RRD47099.1 DNA polymerase III subunit delta' [Tessaracoccus sp. OH4464_COT-324]